MIVQIEYVEGLYSPVYVVNNVNGVYHPLSFAVNICIYHPFYIVYDMDALPTRVVVGMTDFFHMLL